ncbi:NAD(P)/FAD-dependent oxidoreductase [Streptomyces roseoverticillatus]|uniref:FAD-dependent oxidoreductase n=1 Tax=Streptomyces roseoverticillatus TaxID=66429 RepID=UPI001F25D80A|nr:FAD-dependent oxidoreductase [Streptomyces roseoverticillatus]MCF3105439.1 NAD(P)/FAD-dependent oxidoreductase [Streptomyces roseoverticillatus]
MKPSWDVDLLVVGAGPAGVAAAVMASSLRMTCVVVEAEGVGAKLRAIGALENVPGGWSTGAALAEALAGDLARHQELGRVRVLSGRVVRVAGHDDHVEIGLEDGRLLTASAAVVATGVTALAPGDVPWIEAPEIRQLPPLWRVAAGDLAGRRVVVLGADRPLGTWLRTHAQDQVHLDVLFPQGDQYKTDEVAGDPRIRLDLVARVAVTPVPKGFRITAEHPGGGAHVFVVDAVLGNIGSKPAAMPGLVAGEDGYCPPDEQHPRIRVAGDVKGPRMQRIAVAMGDGSRAALEPYYWDQAALGGPFTSGR